MNLRLRVSKLALLTTLIASLNVVFAVQSPALAQTKKVPYYEQADCPFNEPAGRTVQCGYLTVAEDHSNPTNGRTVKIAVAVFKSSSANPQPDPVIYLEGGPGGRTLSDQSVDFYINQAFSPILENRDIILFDQRGTGSSTPSLDCPEMVDANWNNEDKNLSAKDWEPITTKALQDCHDRLVKQGVNLSAFNSAESAADVNDLRNVLGYKALNLYGISYGTRLGLTIMRDFPQGIRSSILDSNIPPQLDQAMDQSQVADHIFRVFFDGCASSPTCNAAYPNLENVFYQMVKDLNAKPASFSVNRHSDGKRFTVLLNGDDVIGSLFFAFYQTQLIPEMPIILWEASKGNPDALNALLQLKVENLDELDPEVSTGMYYSVTCAENVNFDNPADLVKADLAYPKEDHEFDPGDFVAKCKLWNVQTPPASVRDPVKSDIPSLVMEGDYDPVTPPSFGQETAKTLSHNFYVLVPGSGHGASLAGDCPMNILLSFLNDPTTKPDESCLSGMTDPQWLVQGGSQSNAPTATPVSSGSGTT